MSVHAELPLVVESRGGDHHARREQDQSLKAPAVQRNVLYERAVDHGADCRGLGIHERRAGLHGDGLGSGAEAQLEIDFYDVLNVEGDVWLD